MSLIQHFDVQATRPEVSVPPDGPLTARVAFIGEAPTADEVRTGRPFTGRSGSLFNQLLLSVGILRKDVYVTNLFPFEVNKRRAPERLYKGDELLWSDRTGFTSAGESYRQALFTELARTSACVLVPLGNPALSAFGYKGISNWRGSILYDERLNKILLPTFHPASTFHEAENKVLIRFDLERIKTQWKNSTPTLRPRTLRCFPTFEEVLAELKLILDKKLAVSFDIEARNGQVSYLSLSTRSDDALSIQFLREGQDVFSPEQEFEIWSLLDKIFTSESIVKEGQNLTYDNGVLFRNYSIEVKNFHDTMLAMKLVYPGLKMGLQNICSIYTDIPFYKTEGKEFMTGKIKDEKQFSEYNAKDAVVVKEALPKLLADLKKVGNKKIYDVHRRLVPALIYMGEKGLLVDVKGIEEQKLKYEKEISAAQAELNETVGFPLNVRSVKDLRYYFHEQEKVKDFSSFDERTLIRLAAGSKSRRPLPAAKLILEIRKMRNIISKEFFQKKVGDEYVLNLHNNRLTTRYSAITSMGRISSLKDISGAGQNAQNRRNELINPLLCADPGYLIYNVDLSQADARSVAYMGRVEAMMEAYETGKDLYAWLGEKMFGVPYEEIKRQDKAKIPAPLFGGVKTYRSHEKSCVHGLNYGMGPDKFAGQTGLSPADAKRLHTMYHAICPAVRAGYQTSIREQLQVNRTLTNSYGRKWLFLGSLRDLSEPFAFPAQSNTADTINIRGLLPLYYNELKGDFSAVELLRQVHDSINFQIPLDLGIDYHINFLLALKSSLETPLEWKGISFSIPADFKVGFRLSPMTELDFDKPLKIQLETYWR